MVNVLAGYIVVAHMLRMAVNINKGDFRNILERFVRQRDHRKGTMKDMQACNQQQDLRTVERILSVFRAGDFTEPLFFMSDGSS